MAGTLRSSSWASLRSVEFTAIKCFVVVFALLFVGGGAAVIDHWMRESLPWTTAFVVPAAIAEVAFISWLCSAFERHSQSWEPIPEVVRTQRRWFVPLRPVVALWYLAHGAVVFGVVFMFEKIIRGNQIESASPSSQAGVFWSAFGAAALIAVFLAFVAISHAMHLYLLLAAEAVFRSQRLVVFLWRWRLGIDVLLAVLATSILSIGPKRL